MIVIIILRFTSFSSCTVEPSLFEDERRRSLKAAKRGFANSKGVSSKKGGCLIFWMSWVQNTKWSKGSDIPPSNSFLFYSSFNSPPPHSFLFYSPFNIPPPTPFYFILHSTSPLQLLSILFSFQNPPSNYFLFYSPFNIPLQLLSILFSFQHPPLQLLSVLFSFCLPLFESLRRFLSKQLPWN